MESTVQNLLMGFATVFTPTNLMYSFVGCLIGTMVGVLPGVGPLAGISMLLPTTFGLQPTSAIILLAGIYYGAMYGGSTTSILMRIPGEAASVMTCIDGYAMARKGRAGPALSIAAIGSFIAGTISVIGLMLLAPTLAAFALGFGPPEYFCLLVCGLVVLSYMTGGSIVKNLSMICLGLMIGMIGIDQMSGYFRFSYGVTALGDGIGIVPVAVGLFGISEILATAGSAEIREVLKPRLKDLLPSREEFRDSVGPIFRGTFLGFMIGIIPGSAHIISTFVAYAMERRISKHPERFGQGAIEGVAGPEAANNAASEGALVPLLALGVPTGPIPAVLLAALMVHGINPGPLFIKEQPEVFWGLIASMYVGNAVLLLLNLPMVGLFVNFLRIPYRILYPIILLFCVVGVYAVNSSMVDVAAMCVMGLMGYLLRKLDFETAPLVLGVVLAPIIEFSFRQSLAMSGGAYVIFVERPIAVTFLAIALLMMLLGLKPLIFKKKDWRERLTEAEKGG
jgi:putative tricarboxylic transport membrane protein